MTVIVLLNGPRQVGKDYIANAFIDQANSARKLPIMWPGKIAALAELGLLPHTAYTFESDGAKDVPYDRLRGRTPRQVYIEYGERMRETHGESYFAELWARVAQVYKGYGHLVVPDVRFQPEVDEACKAFGAHNVLLVRVRQDNFDWTGDIGSYLTHWKSVEFDNTAQSPDVGVQLQNLVRETML